MALGNVVSYNQFPGILVRDAEPQWDDAVVGTFMWGLVTASYVPSGNHTTAADLGANIITAGGGAPVNVTGRTVVDILPDSYLQANNADFGTITVTSKYLVCFRPITPGVYAATAKLCFYVDLNVGAGLSLSVTATPFIINQPTNGWIRLTKS